SWATEVGMSSGRRLAAGRYRARRGSSCRRSRKRRTTGAAPTSRDSRVVWCQAGFIQISAQGVGRGGCYGAARLRDQGEKIPARLRGRGTSSLAGIFSPVKRRGRGERGE